MRSLLEQKLYRPDDGGGTPTPEGNTPPPETPPETPPIAETPNSVPEWVPGRINALTAARRTAEEALATERAKTKDLEARLAGTQTQTQPGPKTYTEEEVNTRANARAAQMTFEQRSIALANRGREEFPDFNEALNKYVVNLGGLPNEFIEAVLELDDGHRVLHSLSNDMSKAASIMTAGNPVKMATALTKYALTLPKTSPKVEDETSDEPVVRPKPKIPAPITPRVGGGGAPVLSLDNPKISVDDWMKLRKADIKARRTA